jgi:hypothetical protein
LIDGTSALTSPALRLRLNLHSSSDVPDGNGTFVFTATR